MQTDQLAFKAVICRNGFVFKDTIFADSLDDAKSHAERKINKLNKPVLSKAGESIYHREPETFTLIRVEPVTPKYGEWIDWVYDKKWTSHPYFEGDPFIHVRFRDGTKSHRKKRASLWIEGESLFKWGKTQSPNDITGYTVLVPYDVWLPINTAPQDATKIIVRMEDGTVHNDCHFARGDGEDQPPFEGWFVPRSIGYGQISEPKEWMLAAPKIH